MVDIAIGFLLLVIMLIIGVPVMYCFGAALIYCSLTLQGVGKTKESGGDGEGTKGVENGLPWIACRVANADSADHSDVARRSSCSRCWRPTWRPQRESLWKEVCR